MVALYRGGRQADALDVYARTRDTLDDELGLEPSVTLRSLQQRVLRQDESLGAQPELAVPVRTPAGQGRPKERAQCTEWRSEVQGAANATPTNLPTVVRPLIGRDDLLQSLNELVHGVRLLCLVGPGGAGKTSLALTLAVHAREAFPDGVFGVRLASVTTADQVPVAVADALGMPMDGAAAERDIRERIYSYLARRKLLLVLDNCEHVIDAAAGLADDILGRCADVTVLATSREALAVPDEVQVNIGPLDTPPEDAPAAAGPHLLGRAAVRGACPCRAPRHRVRRAHPARDRPHHPSPGRHSTRGRAGGCPRRRHVARRDLRPPGPPIRTPDVRFPDSRGTPADPARHRRLELRAAQRGRATGVQPALPLPGRLDHGRRRGRRRRRRCTRGVRARDRRTPGRTVHGGRRTRFTHPVPDARDAAPVRRGTARRDR